MSDAETRATAAVIPPFAEWMRAEMNLGTPPFELYGGVIALTFNMIWNASALGEGRTHPTKAEVAQFLLDGMGAELIARLENA